MKASSSCHGCGAPLRPHREDCEYCRRRINEITVVETLADGSVKVTERYNIGWTDPRNLYGNPHQNAHNSSTLAQQANMAGVQQTWVSAYDNRVDPNQTQQSWWDQFFGGSR